MISVFVWKVDKLINQREDLPDDATPAIRSILCGATNEQMLTILLVDQVIL